MRLCRGRSDIRTLQDWYGIAPPKRGAFHWKDGRSAKEIARAWCGKRGAPSPPREFLKLLAPLVTPDQFARAAGWPEHQVPIDDLPGEPTNIDLAIVSEGRRGRTAICVEAKADEPFGAYASTVYHAAARRIEQGVPTGSIKRLRHLERLLLPKADAGLPRRAQIRYQLLTGTAASISLARAHQAPVAVFVVHKFLVEGHVDESRLKQNEVDLDRFVTRLTGGKAASLPEGALLGPLSAPSPNVDWGGVSLYLGKVTTRGAPAAA